MEPRSRALIPRFARDDVLYGEPGLLPGHGPAFQLLDEPLGDRFVDVAFHSATSRRAASMAASAWSWVSWNRRAMTSESGLPSCVRVNSGVWSAPMLLNRKGQSDFGSGKASKIPCEGLTGDGEVFAGQVHLKVNRPDSSDSGLVIEPTIPGDDDVVTFVLSAIRNALGLDLEAVPAEQLAQRNVAHGIGRVAVQLVFCHSLAPVHECQYEREQSSPCPRFGATLWQLD